MDSDSESQDSDDGRRFRFETTRKDGQSQRRVSTERSSKRRSRSRSRDRNFRADRVTSRHSLDRSSSRRGRSPKDRKDRKEGSSRRQHDKDHRSHRAKDHRGGSAVESKNDREHRHKRKREKHKKRSGDRCSEHSRCSEESNKRKEDKKSSSNSPSLAQTVAAVATVAPAATAKKPLDKSKVKNKDEKVIANKERPNGNSSCGSYNPVAVISDAMLMTDVVTNAVFNSSSSSSLPPPARIKPRSFFDKIVNKGAIEGDAVYGPALPPQLNKRCDKAKEAESFKTECSVVQVDKSKNVTGVGFPTNLKTLSIQESVENSKEAEEEMKLVDEKEDSTRHVRDNDDDKEDDGTEVFGPALLPSLEKRRMVGPALPENFLESQKIVSSVDDSTVNINDHEENHSDDDNIVGPLPANHPGAKDSYVQIQLEYRAQKVKEKFMDKIGPEKNKREEWMVELPPAHAVALGLGSIPRKFKTREGPDMSDRSVWTDTPADRLRKQKEKEENRFVPAEEKSKKSKIPVEEKRKQREETESLLDMHLKNIKKKKKKAEKEAKESGLPTRRPFDRDLDLQINMLNEAKKKKIFDKARMLDDRFAPGKI